MWKLPATSSAVYKHNTLVQVVCQLRFHPILKITEQVPEFQERVRQVFPEFSVQTTQVIAATALGSVEMQQEKQFLFRKADGSSTLTLTTNSVAVEERRHTDRQSLLKDVLQAVTALRDTHHQLHPTRFGLRYINLIDKEAIASDLGERVEWADLITERFLYLPTGLADLKETFFYSEVRSPTPELGEMVVRHGLLQDQEKGAKFRLDMDRYLAADFDLADIEKLFHRFAADIFCIFRTALGDALLRWMNNTMREESAYAAI